MVPLPLTLPLCPFSLCIAHRYETGRAGELDSELTSTESPSAGPGEEPGITRINSEVLSVQLLPLLTTFDPSQRKTSQEINASLVALVPTLNIYHQKYYLSQEERRGHNSFLMSHVQLSPDRI